MKIEIRGVLLAGLDARLAALQQARASALQPARGWLRAVRTALGLSQPHVAGKVSMTRQSYEDLEAAEERGAISLNSLQRAAGAMDCEFVYFIVPREEIARTYGELAQKHDPDFNRRPAAGHSLMLEDQAGAGLRMELR